MGKKSKKRRKLRKLWLVPFNRGQRFIDNVATIIKDAGPKGESSSSMCGAEMNHFGGWVPPKHSITPSSK